jgi:hypothetical protein
MSQSCARVNGHLTRNADLDLTGFREATRQVFFIFVVEKPHARKNKTQRG